MSSLIEQIDALEPGVVRVFRDADDDIGFREAVLFLDGEEIGWVDYKNVFEARVKSGRHTLYAFNRIFKTKAIEFEIQPAERITFQVANVGGIFFKFCMMLCMGIPSIRLQREVADDKRTSRRAKRMVG